MRKRTVLVLAWNLLLEGLTFAELAACHHRSQGASISAAGLICIDQLNMVHFVWLSASAF